MEHCIGKSNIKGKWFDRVSEDLSELKRLKVENQYMRSAFDILCTKLIIRDEKPQMELKLPDILKDDKELIDLTTSVSKASGKFITLEMELDNVYRKISQLTATIAGTVSNNDTETSKIINVEATARKPRNIPAQVTALSPQSLQLTIDLELITSAWRGMKEKERKDQDELIKRYEEELQRKTEKIKQLEAEKSDFINRKDQDQMIKTYKDELTRKVEKIKQLEAEKSDHIKRAVNQTSKIRTYEEELKRNTEKIKQLEAEKHDLLNSSLAVMKATIKMTYNNPNITNLSDQDRPTKISERFAELYDHQWTDAFEILHEKHNMPDTKAIEFLLDILYVSFKKCKEVRKQREDLENCITKYVGAAAGDLAVLKVMTELKDASKKNLAKRLKDYTKTVHEELQEKYHKELQSVSHYLAECVEICLLMNLHNPALELRGCFENLPFDVTLFRPYTKSGDRIAFMVWPALQLYKDGPLLCRGVAQGMADSTKVQNPLSSKDRVITEKYRYK